MLKKSLATRPAETIRNLSTVDEIGI